MSLHLRSIALFWGFAWAACLQFTRWGRWLAVQRTWITVVVGMGVNMLILWRVLDRRAWWQVMEVLGLSAIGIILRSLMREYQETDAGA